ncbi:DMT family transporter [Desulfohalobiaceae bacterium Ax17]|uniref:DMT family transporter n=1 Tax=Desulfovulcanus ferrireducens TaxID=2831190 RepID=UPI00207BBC79|nr:DMT family transporter [Desulfovulcanus ferrireducens]MBT8762998.1 DMT family transporter [Desulfovulcanus ferrireducens]
MDRQKKAYFYALLTVFIWSTVASAFKISLRYLDHVQLLFYSTLTSSLALGVLCLYFFGPGFWTKFHRPDILRSMFLGLLNPFLYYLILFKAYELLPAQEAQSLNYTWGIALTILSIPLLKQRINFYQILAIFVSYSGVVVISTHGQLLELKFSNPMGATLALVSTIIWSLYWISNTKDDLDPILRLFLNFCFGLIFIFLYLRMTSHVTIYSLPGILGAIYVGLFEMGITFVFWLKALKLSRTTAQVSNLIYLSPFLSLIFIHFFVGEKILPSTIIGLMLILSGLIVQNMTHGKVKD